MAQHNEVEFERELCEHLAAHGWLYSPNDDGYDRQRAMFPEDVFAWLEESQPEELAKRLKPGLSASVVEKAKNNILDRLAKVLDVGQPGGGTLHVLRTGFKDTPASFAMMQQRPDLAGNETTKARYAANRLRVMRQVHYSSKNHNSLDLVLFVNGIPVATAELKTDFTQSVNDAKAQYRTDRKPAGEPLLGFGTRALVHFAVSNDEVWMTTKLAGTDTRFLPFNRGNHGHAGNAPDPSGLTSPTAYLWQEVWQRDRWLEILSKFMHYETVTPTDAATGKKSKGQVLIFPRYHQLDAVTALLGDVRASGPGQRYLIQHSAGSGKTRTIAWTAHRLATLHDTANSKVFDSVIVVTDRNVLDAQLQEAVKQIEAKDGFVATINTREAAKRSFSSKSDYLTDVLTAGKPIIVVTLQTFPFVLQAIQENQALKGRSFAVIADEAHSSQTGAAASKLKQVLSAAEAAELDDGGEVDVEAILAAEAKAKADTRNISFFAFTATPKSKTMELFGTPDAAGLPGPFHTYTMQQAIEEQFILDVLANYTTYDTAFQLATKVKAGAMAPVHKLDESGELVDESAATKGLMRWVKLHPTNIAQKVQIIVEHFEANVKHLLGGTAKAMVVTDSRKAAVRYKQAIDSYIAQHQLPEVTSLVAFSGEVEFTDADAYPGDHLKPGDKFTEATLNPGAGDLRKAFETGEYRVMIVANKFQTGFDQPKLCAMYVDKQLAGVAAVQTLSRLNRFVPGKATMVLDFVNDGEEILAAFKPYFEEASLVATTDPNLIHDIGNKLDNAGIYTLDDVDAVATAFVRKKGNNAITGAIQPAKHAYIAAYNAAKGSGDQQRIDELDTFRKDVSTYVRLYDFLSQIVDFGDTDVEKHAIFFRLLATVIKAGAGTPEIDLADVQLVHIKQKNTGSQTLDLTDGEPSPALPTAASAAGSRKAQDPRLKLLDEIVAELNARFAGEEFRDDQERSWVEALVAAMRADDELREQAEVNSEAQFLASPSLRDAVTLAVVDTNDAHSRMVDLFHAKNDIEVSVIHLLGKLLYLDVNSAL